MKSKNNKNYLILPIVLILSLLFAYMASGESVTLFGIPLIIISVLIIFVIQWLAFIPAFIFQTEKFYDLVGSLTYLITIYTVFFVNKSFDSRSILVLSMITIWAVRLGSFLFYRVHKTGKDGRFDEMKKSFIRFLNAWTIQGMWVTLTLLAALIVLSSGETVELGYVALTGAVLWVIGFLFEAIADFQKSRFKSNPDNKGKFINSGLWSLSRHPNYFGEIVLWAGILVIAIPLFSGLQWIGLISPVFVTILLTKISGIPILEKRGDDKWGGQKDYEKYKQETPVLIPKLKK
jgi:steroid 5-alpha reductase family enzyme